MGFLFDSQKKAKGKEEEEVECAEVNCTKNESKGDKIEGGHVNKTSGDDDDYLTPLCDEHNHPRNEEPFDVYERDLVKIKTKKEKEN